MRSISEICSAPKWPKIDVDRGNAHKLKCSPEKAKSAESVSMVCQSSLNKHKFDERQDLVVLLLCWPQPMPVNLAQTLILRVCLPIRNIDFW